MKIIEHLFHRRHGFATVSYCFHLRLAQLPRDKTFTPRSWNGEWIRNWVGIITRVWTKSSLHTFHVLNTVSLCQSSGAWRGKKSKNWTMLKLNRRISYLHEHTPPLTVQQLFEHGETWGPANLSVLLAYVYRPMLKDLYRYNSKTPVSLHIIRIPLFASIWPAYSQGLGLVQVKEGWNSICPCHIIWNDTRHTLAMEELWWKSLAPWWSRRTCPVPRCTRPAFVQMILSFESRNIKHCHFTSLLKMLFQFLCLCVFELHPTLAISRWCESGRTDWSERSFA